MPETISPPLQEHFTLEGFRAKMNQLINDLKGKDATIEEIKNTQNLLEEECFFWNQYIRSLEQMTAFGKQIVLQGSIDDDVQEKIRIFAKSMDALGNVSKKRQNQAIKELATDRSQFYNWMNNRLSIVTTNSLFVSELPAGPLNDDDKTEMEDIFTTAETEYNQFK